MHFHWWSQDFSDFYMNKIANLLWILGVLFFHYHQVHPCRPLFPNKKKVKGRDVID